MSHDKEDIFKKDEKRITEILDKGIDNIIQDKPALFDLKEKTLKCMDERTPGGIHLAGAGILLGLCNAVEFVKRANIDKVTWHEECGAVGLALKKRGEKWKLKIRHRKTASRPMSGKRQSKSLTLVSIRSSK